MWYHLTGEKDERTPEDVLNSVPHMTTPEEAKDILDSQLDKIYDIVNSKFLMVYNLLGQPGEHRVETCTLSMVLEGIRFWYKDAIEWNLTAKRPVSDIPNDFKDIYFKLYDSSGNLILSDEYTLKSVGLAKQWVRNDTINKNKD